MQSTHLNVPPFPPLTWDTFYWTGTLRLPFWSGFQTRRGAYASVSSNRVSDGTVQLTIPSIDEEATAPPTPQQARALEDLLARESSIGSQILNGIFADYPKRRELYEYDNQTGAQVMPAIQRADQLQDLIGLSTVHILTVAKDDVAYVGFEFGCEWDQEHGLGVMTHRGRIVKIGGADTSFLEWVAEDDVG